jgi:hypothetical protein
MIVLHVGPHKTATTWLQYNFYHNKSALEKAGWLYPQTGVRVRTAHHDLSDHPEKILDDRSPLVAELRRIAQKASDGNLNILLSSEGFRHFKPEHLQALKAIMAPHALQIVYCVRDPASMMHSYWTQQIRAGKHMTFPDFHDRQFARPARSKILNPLAEIEPLAQLDGASLTILLYDEIRRQNLDIFDVFVSDILKIAPLPHSEEARVNDRQPVEMTEFMRLVASRIGAWREGADIGIGRAFQYMMPRRTEEKIVATVGAVEAARRTLIIDRSKPIFRKVERDLLAGYRSMMVPEPKADKLFLEGPQECVYYDSAQLETDPAVAKLLTSVQNTFRPGGLRLWVLNWSRFWLSLYRRIMKSLRR